MKTLRARLRQWLTATDGARQIAAWRRQHPAATLFTLRLDLDSYSGDWLDWLATEHTPFCYLACAAESNFQLGLGLAWQAQASGHNRLAQLEETLHRRRQHWLGDEAGEICIGFAFHEDSPAPPANAQLSLPVLWLTARAGRAQACFSSTLGDYERNRQEILAALDTPPEPSPGNSPPTGASHSSADAATWNARVARALEAIAAGTVEKLVLAREIEVSAAQIFSIPAILRRLLQQQAGSQIYAQREGERCFLGATPENLVTLSAGQVRTDALAGTAWPDSPALEEHKNCREQQYVVDAIRATLAAHCREGSLYVTDREKHPAGPLVHWRSRVGGTAKAATTLLQLAAALHPTPAVGGFPPAAAWRWLHAAGEIRPDWYSGGIGKIAANGDGELWVALRSALLHGRHARLQAGAGIVAGSDAATEYRETDAKFSGLLQALLG